MKVLKKVGGFVLGAVGAVVGFIAGGPLGAVYGFSIGMGIGSAAQMMAMKSKVPDVSSATQQRLNVSIDPDANRKIAFGETALGTDQVYWETWGPESSYFDQVIAAAGHEIESFGKLFFDDEEVTFSGDNATGAYADALTKGDRVVGVSGTALTVGAGSKWTSACSLTGVAHYALRIRWSQEKYPRGIPSRITRVGQGALVYDPRRDSTRGGSGSHRADDQSTWEYAPVDSNGQPIGRNPALQILWYEIGWRVQNPDTGEWVLVCGRGRPLDDIDFASFITAANDCEDEGYYSDVLLSTGDGHPTNIAVLEAACAGKLMDPGGRISLRIRCDTTGDIVQAFTDDDIVDTEAAVWRPALPDAERWNQGRGSFVDPRALFRVTPLPFVVRDASYEAEDGWKRPGPEFRFDAVQDPDQAQKLIRLELNISRYMGVFTAPFNWRAKKIKIWDIVTLTSPSDGFDEKLFRVLDKKTDPMGAIWLLLREDDPSIYTGGTVNPVPAPTPGAGYDARFVTPPDAGDWVVTPTYREGGGAKIPILTVDSPETPPNIVATHVYQKLEPSGSWVYVGRFTAGAPINLDLTFLLPGQQYSLRLIYENAYGAKSAATDMGPYDAPDEWIVPTAGFAENISEELLADLEEYSDNLVAAEAAAREAADNILEAGIGVIRQVGYRNWFRDPLITLGSLEGYGSNGLATYTLTASGYRAAGVERASGSSGAEMILYLPGNHAIQPGARGQAAVEIEETSSTGTLELRAYYYDDAGGSVSPAHHVIASGASGRLAGFFGLAGTDAGAIPAGTASCKLAVRTTATGAGAARFAVSHMIGAFAGIEDTTPADFVDPADEQVARQLDYTKVEIGNAMQLRGLSWEAGEARSEIVRLDSVSQSQATALTTLQTSYGDVSANATFRMQTSSAPSGWSSRIGMQARVSAGGVWRAAGIYLDVNESLARIVMSADQVAIESGGAISALFQSGTAYFNMAFFANASITNALIQNMSATKLTAGVIDTGAVTLRNAETGARQQITGAVQEVYYASGQLAMRRGIVSGLPLDEMYYESGQLMQRSGAWS